MVPIYVLYGTETLNSEGCAERAGEAIEALGLEVVVCGMDEIEHELLPHLHTVLVVTSTFGNGEPPANAEELHGWLHSEDAPSLAETRFSVCGLGDSEYPDFCQCAKDFDLRLEQLGARRFVPRQDCDADFEPPFEAWLDAVLAALPQFEYPDEEEGSGYSALSVDLSAEKEAPAVGTRKNPFLATVLKNKNLNEPGSEKETRHVALSLVGSGMRYRVGDSLGLFPSNCPDLVRRILAAFGIDRDSPVQHGGETKTVRYVLVHHKDVNALDKRLLELARGASDGRWNALLDDPEARKRYIDAHHVIDFAEAVGVRVAPQDLVDRLRTLAPRLYSISSSPLMHPGEVHLTVDVLRYDLHGKPRKGVASTFLAERCGPDVEVPVYLRPTSDFLLCDDDVPIIMVGPGTGIAPFRAFLEERAARGVTDGYAWLFFGARHEATDYLYREELLHYHESGVLTRLDTAFSRDGERKVYVQDRMWEHGPDFWAWLEAGAVVYVCGDASRMAKDVDERMVRIIAQHGRMTIRDAEAYVKQMSAEHRYLRDVY